jgi:hypothetical protein
VRTTHQALNGITLPIDHAFWHTHYPPNGWHCRCDIIALDEDEAQATDLSKRTLPTIPPIFRGNTAKEGIIFPEKHPYFGGITKEIKDSFNDLANENSEATQHYYTILEKDAEFKKDKKRMIAEGKDKNLPQLNEAQRTAVYHYTSKGYQDLNKWLLKKDVENLEERLPYLNAYKNILKDTLDKLPDYAGEVYRGVTLPKDIIEKKYKDAFKNKTPIIEEAFTSTSKDIGKSYEESVKFVFQCKRGKHIEKISAWGHDEEEVLLNAGSRFMVIDIKETNKLTTIYMEEI